MPDGKMFEEQTADYAASDALLLGRRTYEIFATSWPERGSDVDNADWMNNTQKHVASTTLEAPEWQNTTVLEGDVHEEVSRLKQAGREGHHRERQRQLGAIAAALGAAGRAPALPSPARVGIREKLFDEKEEEVALELTDSHIYGNSVISLSYGPAAVDSKVHRVAGAEYPARNTSPVEGAWAFVELDFPSMSNAQYVAPFRRPGAR